MAQESNERKRRREALRQHVDRSLIVKARLYAVISAAAFLISIVESAQSNLDAWLATGVALIVGLAIGRVASRSQRLSWDSFELKVVGIMDVLGGLLLVAYVAFVFLRDRIVGIWVPPDHVASVSMALLAGAMMGQLLGIRAGFRRLGRRLRSQPEILGD